ncbi:MAG: hypothetical protein QXU75_09270 [Candidatus Methanomethylicaceae archaeon]
MDIRDDMDMHMKGIGRETKGGRTTREVTIIGRRHCDFYPPSPPIKERIKARRTTKRTSPNLSTLNKTGSTRRTRGRKVISTHPIEMRSSSRPTHREHPAPKATSLSKTSTKTTSGNTRTKSKSPQLKAIRGREKLT